VYEYVLVIQWWETIQDGPCFPRPWPSRWAKCCNWNSTRTLLISQKWFGCTVCNWNGSDHENVMFYLKIQLHRLVDIQSRLFDLGAAIATPVNNSSEEKILYTKVCNKIICFGWVDRIDCWCDQFPSVHTINLESWIDELDCQLPPLTNFVLPVSLHK
jgi:hypothetical protein